MRLRVSHQLSQVGPILARFLDYNSLFWGPKLISTIDEPRGAFTCRSSTLAAFVDSDPFHGLLLAVLGPKRFQWLFNPKVRLRVGHQQSQFWLILARFLDYYCVLGSRSDFHD